MDENHVDMEDHIRAGSLNPDRPQYNENTPRQVRTCTTSSPA